MMVVWFAFRTAMKLAAMFLNPLGPRYSWNVSISLNPHKSSGTLAWLSQDHISSSYHYNGNNTVSWL